MRLGTFLHVAMTVTDMDTSILFYTRLLGFKLDGRGPFIVPPEQKKMLFGVGRSKVEMAHVSTSGLGIELFCFHQPRSLPRRSGDRFRAVGLKHIAFAVRNFSGYVARLRRHGVAFQFKPFVIHPPSGTKILYFKDPDQTTIEILGK